MYLSSITIPFSQFFFIIPYPAIKEKSHKDSIRIVITHEDCRIHRARQGAKDSRKYLTAILNDIAYSNDFFIIKLFKLVFAMFVAVESASREREVKRLQEKNQQIKALAKNIVSESQTVGEHLRNKDIENIERILSEYEYLLQGSLRVINSQYYPLQHEEKTYEEI